MAPHLLVSALIFIIAQVTDVSNLAIAAEISRSAVCATVGVASPRSTGLTNILQSHETSAVATITNMDQATKLRGRIIGIDESGALRFFKNIEIAEASQTQVDFDVQGYVALSVELRRETDGHVCHASTRSFGRISPPKAEQKGEFMGLWHVSGPSQVLPLLGAKWTRQFFSINCYRRNAKGMICDTTMIDKRNRPLLRIPGVKVIATLAGGFPDWIEKQPVLDSDRKKVYPVANRAALNEILQALREEIAAEPEYFEIYNEPDAKFSGSKAELAEFVRVVGHAIKNAFPNTKVLGPSFYKIRPGYFSEMVKLGVLDDLDGIAMHAYVDGTPPEEEFIRNVDSLLESISSKRKNLPIFLTEFGWTTAAGTWQKPVSELDQARYLVRAALLLAARDIDASVFFNLYYSGAPNKGEGEFSLLRADGSPKPGLIAFTTAARWIDSWGGKPKAYKLPRGRWMVAVQTGTDVSGGLWSEREDTDLVFKPEQVVRLESMTGESLHLSTGRRLRISSSPVFFQLTGSDTPSLLRALGD